jgi:hypothetical protein
LLQQAISFADLDRKQLIDMSLLGSGSAHMSGRFAKASALLV